MVPSRLLAALACLLVCLALSLGTATAQRRAASSIKLRVFYEGLDNYSRSFFEDQLLPTYNKINKNKQFMSIDLVPYGKANTTKSGKISFSCEHDKSECKMNILMACGINLAKQNSKSQLEFSTCVLKVGSGVLKKIKLCAGPAGLNEERLDNCYHGKKGKQLEKKMGELTPKNIYERPLPMVEVNGKYNADWDIQVKKDALKFVCEHLGHVPAGCAERNFAFRSVWSAFGRRFKKAKKQKTPATTTTTSTTPAAESPPGAPAGFDGAVKQSILQYLRTLIPNFLLIFDIPVFS